MHRYLEFLVLHPHLLGGAVQDLGASRVHDELHILRRQPAPLQHNTPTRFTQSTLALEMYVRHSVGSAGVGKERSTLSMAAALNKNYYHF